jgi:transcriptional regulator with XRE-family HTH domain
MGWSERFAKYIKRKKLTQQEVGEALRAEGLRVTQSQVYYWTRGSKPRESTRMRIAEWSRGAVPAHVPEAKSA